MPLEVKVDRNTPGVARVALKGRLDNDGAPVLESQLGPVLGAAPGILVFDLKELAYISSAGLRVIFKSKKSMEAHQGRVGMVNLQPAVKKVFEIVNALPDLQIFKSVAELDSYLDHMQRKS